MEINNLNLPRIIRFSNHTCILKGLSYFSPFYKHPAELGISSLFYNRVFFYPLDFL